MESIEPHSPIDYDDDEEEHDLKVDDRFQDAGELDLSAAYDSLFLTRMPKFTWEAFSALKDDDELQVGILRLEGDKRNPARASLKLHPDVNAFKLIPREYNLRVMNKSSSNTFVFTEKDLPGYKRKAAGHGAAATGNPQGVEKKEGYARKNMRRRAIPKKTALAGHVKSEFNCLPVENQEYVSILTRRQAELPKNNLAPQVMEGLVGVGNILNPGGVGAGSSSNFIKTAPPRAKPQQSRAARIPRNDLLDLLFKKFSTYKYYYLRTLRQELEVPESFLREVLEEIAYLIPRGPFANTWTLKEESKLDGRVDPSSTATAQETIAPILAETEGQSDDNDGYDTVKMEDAS